MKKNYYLLLVAIVCFAGKSYSQMRPCGTDEMRRQMIAAHPEILKYEAEIESQMKSGLKKINYNKAAKTTFTDQSGNPDFWYDIPIVIHVIHNFGTENLSDNAIYNDLKDWNIVYSAQNPDTASVIEPFKKYIGNVHIRLHLATIDPNGNPTKGITRHRSYLTYYGGEQAKLDDWSPTNYVNIWAVNTMSPSNFEAAAYAFFPSEVSSDPFGDGVIALADYFADAYDGAPNAVSKTIPHELGHVFNLEHPWGDTNNPGVACGDDGVDDTPPTMGHEFEGCAPLSTGIYDTVCASNYYKIYPSVNLPVSDSLVNYPDTTNAQNLMDYTYCARMLTKGQAARMHDALNSDVAGRDNLWDSTNLSNTGALAPVPDLQPIPDFSVTNFASAVTMGNYMTSVNYFTFPNNGIKFINESWNDTVQSILWTFSNGASKPTSTRLTADTISFTQPGWVTMVMAVTGNNSGTATDTFHRAVFVSDSVATPGADYFEDFSNADTAKWPMFNYYNNEFKWQLANVGMYDNSSVEYLGYDSRLVPLASIVPLTGCPYGDFDDLFSIPADLSGFSGPCYLNFNYSGASRSSNSLDINDTLEVDYAIKTSTGAMSGWNKLTILSKNELDNKGAIATPYTPSSPDDWAAMGISVPSAAKTNYTVFRFRYRPSVAVGYDGTVLTGQFSSGNNFYMDRVNFSPWPASVANINMDNLSVAVAPNPTNGDAYVIIKDAGNTTAKVVVSDITGKVVYTISQQLPGGDAHIQIPHSAISVQGMYIVQTITGSQVTTRKLVVE